MNKHKKKLFTSHKICELRNIMSDAEQRQLMSVGIDESLYLLAEVVVDKGGLQGQVAGAVGAVALLLYTQHHMIMQHRNNNVMTEGRRMRQTQRTHRVATAAF
jgi:hypothetical protein